MVRRVAVVATDLVVEAAAVFRSTGRAFAAEGAEPMGATATGSLTTEPDRLTPEERQQHADFLAKHGGRPITFRYFHKNMIGVLRDALRRVKTHADSRIDQLEQRLATLEARPAGLKYVGVWQRAAVYERHDGVTHKGSTWACIGDRVSSEPGTDHGWQLTAKAGRDGRDAVQSS